MPTYFGTPNNRSMELITGSQGDDAFYPLGGWDIVQAQGGFDTVFVHGLPTADVAVLACGLGLVVARIDPAEMEYAGLAHLRPQVMPACGGSSRA